jgi:hypothetical protein
LSALQYSGINGGGIRGKEIMGNGWELGEDRRTLDLFAWIRIQDNGHKDTTADASGITQNGTFVLFHLSFDPQLAHSRGDNARKEQDQKGYLGVIFDPFPKPGIPHTACP